MTAARSPAIWMRWARLLFLHWPMPVNDAAKLLPPGLEVDTFGGTAWIGLVPFRMEATHVRGIPRPLERMTGMSAFFECNVRTYARVGDRRGVWFCSLDAERLVPVLGGRWLWGLNYVHGRFDVEIEGDRVRYELCRFRGEGRTHIDWEAEGPLPPSEPGSLEHFLTERYLLFVHRRGRLFAGRVEHEPWPLRKARLHALDDTLVPSAGVLASVRGEPLALASDGVDVRGYPLEPVAP